MRIIVVPEQEAIRQSETVKEPTAIVSITGPKEPDVTFADNPQVKKIFRMRFHDLDEHEADLLELDPPKQEDVAGLKAFVDTLRLDGIELLIVHCAAGISRSAGVGCAIDEYLGLDHDFWRDKYYHPNRLVYKLCCKELGMARTEEDYESVFNIRKETSMWWSKQKNYYDNEEED